MKKMLLLAAAATLALAGSAVAQDKKQLVIVVKGLDNPFFEAIHQGCEKWNSENASSEYQCFYTGPASTSDEAGEAQIVADMLAKPTTVAMAISPSNAPLIAQTIKSANPSIPARIPSKRRRRTARPGRRASRSRLLRRRPSTFLRSCSSRRSPRRGSAFPRRSAFRCSSASCARSSLCS